MRPGLVFRGPATSTDSGRKNSGVSAKLQCGGSSGGVRWEKTRRTLFRAHELSRHGNWAPCDDKTVFGAACAAHQALPKSRLLARGCQGVGAGGAPAPVRVSALREGEECGLPAPAHRDQSFHHALSSRAVETLRIREHRQAGQAGDPDRSRTGSGADARRRGTTRQRGKPGERHEPANVPDLYRAAWRIQLRGHRGRIRR